VKTATGNPVAAAPIAAPADATNKYCADVCPTRERKSWNFLTPNERSLYIEAVQTLYSSGIYTKFVMIHQDGVNDPFAHGTSGFLPWHRKFLLEYENALRCLDVKFQCVTIPVWDWSEWQFYCNKQGGCSSYAELPAQLKKDNPNAESLLTAFGGPGTSGPLGQQGKPFGGTGQQHGVGCVTTGPFAGWKDWEGNCLTRGVNWSLKDKANGPLTDRMTLITLTTGQDNYGLDKGYRAGLQGTPHNMAHNYLGGHMRSMRSPMDPIFFSHHAFVDKNWATWQVSHPDPRARTRTPRTRAHTHSLTQSHCHNAANARTGAPAHAQPGPPWQDCKDFEELTSDKLAAREYEGADKVKPGPKEKRTSDHIDAPMPFKITLDAFKPDPNQCSDPASAASACRQCLKKLRPQDDWCSKRWHSSCDMLCAAEECCGVCGTGGVAKDINSAADFKRTDGKPFPYVFDYHQVGEAFIVIGALRRSFL
jgi:tyrosinase